MSKKVQVIATRLGYYNNRRTPEGKKFVIDREKEVLARDSEGKIKLDTEGRPIKKKIDEFGKTWMQLLPENKVDVSHDGLDEDAVAELEQVEEKKGSGIMGKIFGNRVSEEVI